MLKLIIYKKNAYVYLFGGTKEAIIIDKNADFIEILNTLHYEISRQFWDSYEGFYNKGKFYKVKTVLGTANLFEKLIKGEN